MLIDVGKPEVAQLNFEKAIAVISESHDPAVDGKGVVTLFLADKLVQVNKRIEATDDQDGIYSRIPVSIVNGNLILGHAEYDEFAKTIIIHLQNDIFQEFIRDGLVDGPKEFYLSVYGRASDKAQDIQNKLHEAIRNT